MESRTITDNFGDSYFFFPQFLTLIITVVLIIAFSIFAYYKVSKEDPTKPPSKFTAFLIGYVSGFEKLMMSLTGNKLTKAYPYLFMLFNFILVSTLLSIFGFIPTPSALTFTFTLAMISFIGIYVVGIATNGIWNFCKHKYSNPIEILGQISPLLSLSLRLFGATLATYVIGELFVIIFEGIGQSELAIWYPLISVPWSWVWTIIDSALSIIQAYVFVVLTALYWGLEHGPSWKKQERKAYFEAEKERKKQLKKEEKKLE